MRRAILGRFKFLTNALFSSLRDSGTVQILQEQPGSGICAIEEAAHRPSARRKAESTMVGIIRQVILLSTQQAQRALKPGVAESCEGQFSLAAGVT